MELGGRPLFISVLMTYISALQNGIDHGITYCKRTDRNIGVTMRVEKGDFGYIASDGFPNNYTTQVYHGHLCNVELQACSTCKIRLKFVELRFPDCEAQQTIVVQQIRSVCVTGCDHIRLFEVDQPYHSTTERNYFASAEGNVYETISSGVVIQHCMSNSTNSDGKLFYIKYEVIDKKQTISGTITAPLYSVGTGTIESPNFPHGYALNGETFTYTVQNLDPYGHVRLVFDDWDLAAESYIEVIDGQDITTIYGKKKRPTIISTANTLGLVFNVGQNKFACCDHIGFKATYTFVSDDKWTNRPRTDCSGSYLLTTGGEIHFQTDPSKLPQWYDCVWTIKKYMADYPDGVTLRLDNVRLGEGWSQGGENSLEIYEGVTSQGDIIAKYTTENFTSGNVHFSSGNGLYIRLQGVFNMADQLTMVYTAVTNFSDGCPSTAGFLCDNMWCIDEGLTCDGVNHCGDNSDESTIYTCLKDFNSHIPKQYKPRDEPRYVTESHIFRTTTEVSCFGKFRCHDDSGCIDTWLTCDDVDHCADRSDETGCDLSSMYISSGEPSSKWTLLTFPFIVCLSFVSSIFHHCAL